MTKRTRAAGLDAMNPACDDPKLIRCFNPSTGHLLGTVPVDSAEKVTEVVSAARKAQVKWARTSFEERRLVVRKIAKAVHKHRDAICKLSALDTGKTSEPSLLTPPCSSNPKLDARAHAQAQWHGCSSSHRAVAPVPLLPPSPLQSWTAPLARSS